MVESKPGNEIVKSAEHPATEANEMKSPLYIRQVTEERGWPLHVENLLKENLESPVNVHHISAAVVFVMCLECGFIPEDKNNTLPDAETIYKTLDCEKIPRFSSTYPDSSRVPECLSVIFRAVLDSYRRASIIKAQPEPKVHVVLSHSEVTESAIPSTSQAIPPNNLTNDEHSSVPLDDKQCSPGQKLTSENSENLKPRFSYSPPIKLVIVILDDCIQINGMHQKCNSRNYRLSYKFKIQEYSKKPIVTVNERGAITKLASDWISELALDTPRMVQDFKSEFALPLMDSIGGLSNELRGIESLPPEVLIQVLKLCPGKTVLHVGQTSSYLNSVADDQSLWRHLIWRDYKNSRHVNDSAVRDAGKKPPDPDADYTHDYKIAYKRLWVTSIERVNLHRRANWDDFEYEDYDDYYNDPFSDDDDDMALLRFI